MSSDREKEMFMLAPRWFKDVEGVFEEPTSVKEVTMYVAFTLEELADLIAAREATVAKSYGSCEKCYGKGYATVDAHYHASADFIGDRSYDFGGLEIRYCDCERGRQLQGMVSGSEAAAVGRFSEKLAAQVKNSPITDIFRTDPVSAYYEGRDDAVNAMWRLLADIGKGGKNE